MERLWKRRHWLVLGFLLLASVLVVGFWGYGWAGGDIDVFDFTAEKVERVELYTNDVNFTANYMTGPGMGSGTSTVTERADIQRMIDTINAFQYAGNQIRDIIEYGVALGGGIRYELEISFTDGTKRLFFLSTYDTDPARDMILGYGFYQEKKLGLLGKQGRGRMEWFYDLYEKYRPIPEKEAS